MALKFAKPQSRARLHKSRRLEKEIHWRSVRACVLIRDGYRCRRCKSREGIEVHHLKPRSLGREDTTANLVCLCMCCHRERHAYRLNIIGTDANKGLAFEVVR